jgi:hypothetical protein
VEKQTVDEEWKKWIGGDPRKARPVAKPKI